MSISTERETGSLGAQGKRVRDTGIDMHTYLGILIQLQFDRIIPSNDRHVLRGDDMLVIMIAMLLLVLLHVLAITVGSFIVIKQLMTALTPVV